MPTETIGERVDRERERTIKLIKKVGTIAGCVIGALILLSGIYTVDQGYRGAHTRMGALVDIVEPGMHFKFPFIDGVKKLKVRTQTLRWAKTAEGDSRLETYSQDQQPAQVAITVTWSALGDEKSVSETFTKYGSVAALESAVIVPSVSEGFKNRFGNYNSVNAIQKRAMLNLEVSDEVKRLTKGAPVRIESVQIQDIAFSEAYENAVEARMTAQVEVEKKTQEKLTSQIAADMMVIDAEAKAKAVKLAGDAEASAIRAKADALAQNARLVEYTAAQRWDGVLPSTMVPGGSVPMISLAK